jgi:hypothetical protein
VARWVQKVKNYNAVKVQSSYALEDSERGKVVFVVAPGVSFDAFPKEFMDDFTTIGVNSIAEIYSPTYWLFQEGYFCKKYHQIYTSPWIRNVVTSWPRAAILQKVLPAGKGLYAYGFNKRSVFRAVQDDAFVNPEKPFWHDPDEAWLPGHNSVAANAMSLAVLMGAGLMVLVGVDLHWSKEGYYADGIRRNSGPRDRTRALSASRAWMGKAAKKGVWRGPRIITSSRTLKLRGVENFSAGKVVEIVREFESLSDHPVSK